ncbi:hypothetical protein EGK75_09110 [Neisseria weixii]|uniref:Phage tail protein n=1 Tax=Neisseria weixii TaxID=1853276 RepID=A0A3N4NBE3_9NEIS|nr:hypothetical protein [Neisseria weixii]RPD86270.1 hypothetical protein EGK75_09110 [Neisseria weixii]RPD89410.1 hypothetical protein EGK74_04105 [Neisseria weixii]
MALKLNKKIQHEARWVDFMLDGEKVARFLVNPIDDSRYQVAVERMRNRAFLDGFSVDNIAEDAPTWFRNDAEATARYLIADWEGLEDSDGLAIAYTPEKAVDVLLNTDVGAVIWAFVKDEAEKIQSDAEAEKAEAVKKP